jgi:hypothetical protein
MEDKPKNRLEDLTPEERVLLVQMSMQSTTIEEYVMNLDEKFPAKQLLALDDILNESYDEFLPKLDTDNLHKEFVDFKELLITSNQTLIVYLSEYFENFVTPELILSKIEIQALRSIIERAKNKIIPRLKKLLLNDSAEMLEESIRSLEIKLAYDSGAEE